MDNIEFIRLSMEEQKILLDTLGYDVDESGFILSKESGSPHICPLTKEKVLLNEASVLPGST
ncbi:MAG: hypothetical protein HY520_05025, partial [Candidatus Aenigmarchaeota archaeon]|nr:hypothetical protein [Candidatus Aenigmarchaeota archaeon]